MEDSTQFAQHTNYRPMGEWGGVLEYGGGARGMVALFYNKSVHSPQKSADSGRPVYEDRVFVRIAPPGERLNIVDRPATDQDRRTWAQQWAQYQQNKQQTPEGTPISLLYPDHPAVGDTLRAFGIHTIEQCGELTAHAIDTIGMGAQRYVNDAQKFLKMSERGVKATEFRREVEERDGQIRVLTRQLEEMQGEIRRLTEQTASGAGLQQLQTMIAGVMQRPVHVPNAGFDAASAQIAANHPTAQVTQQRPKRQRVRAT